MPIPTKAGDTGYWVLYRADATGAPSDQPVEADLAACPRCDERLRPLAADTPGQPIFPHVFIEVRWEGHSAPFPVRFDDKARLPLLLVGRKPTEGELIDYFLFGKEPDEWEDGSGLPGEDGAGDATDAPIDTRRILAYFIRRFVQAIPGIEAEVQRAAYSRAALDAALRGPTSPLELAERAFHSLTRPPASDEPQKTPVAVGFQLTEILAALRRCQVPSPTPICGSVSAPSSPGVGSCWTHSSRSSRTCKPVPSQTTPRGFSEMPDEDVPRNRPGPFVASGLRQQEGVQRPDRVRLASASRKRLTPSWAGSSGQGTANGAR